MTYTYWDSRRCYGVGVHYRDSPCMISAMRLAHLCRYPLCTDSDAKQSKLVTGLDHCGGAPTCANPTPINGEILISPAQSNCLRSRFTLHV